MRRRRGIVGRRETGIRSKREHSMKKVLLVIFVIACGFGLGRSQQIDVTQLEQIGPVTSYLKTEKGITLNCSDNSQVQLTVLAQDLIRVRTSFTRPIPTKDHSWAIAKENWDQSALTVNETAEAITIATTEVEVVIHRSPLLIEFRDARTHQTINADE